MGSPAGQLGTTDWKKIGSGAVIALLGFSVAYLSDSVIPKIDQTNTVGMIAVAVCGVAINLIRKLLTDTSK